MRLDCTINDYLDAASDRIATLYNLTKPMSDRELARRLKVGHSTLNHWRKGRSLPDDTIMVAIAEKAGENIELALIHLSAWRATEPARSVYAAMASRLGRSAAALFCAGFLGGIGVIIGAHQQPAAARMSDADQSVSVSQSAVFAFQYYTLCDLRTKKR